MKLKLDDIRKIIVCLTFFSLVIPANSQQNKQPYTSQPEDLGSTYRFIVLGDLTGGEVPGLFSYAVDRINELAPDFVITVGDLIEGYTSDKKVILGQWNDFHQRLQKLNAPFYYMAGNHDVGNPVLQAVWDSLYGYSHYTFHANKDLFIVLNTFEAGKEGISPEQFQKMKQQILSHPSNDHIFVFSHGPLWKNFDDFLSLLESRKVYYFCGHEHHYIHKVYKGQDHYMLPGLAADEGKNEGLGLFHGLMYVTVTPSKTYLSNIKLEGLLPPSIVDESTEKQVNMLLKNNWAKLKPSIIHTNYPNEITSTLTINNVSDYPLHVNVDPKMAPGIKFHIMDDFEVAAGTTKTFDVNLETSGKLNIDSLSKIGLQLAGYMLQPEKNISSTFFVEWIVDKIRECNPNTNHYTFCANPGEIGEDWDWSGTEDGSFEYKVYSDKNYIYINVKTIDDILIRRDNNSQVADKISIFFSPDTTLKVSTYAAFDFVPGINVFLNKKSSLYPVTFEGKCNINGTSIEAILKISRKHLKSKSFRINLSFTDSDNTINLDPSVIWWKPQWNSQKDYAGAGVFLFE